MEVVYRHTPEMGEISGFGNGYEEACQDMLEAGCKWLDEHDTADLQGRTITNVFGIFDPTSDDAKELSEVVGKAAEDCTGAMHQSVMQRLFWIAKNGWLSYVQHLTKQNKEDAE